MNTRDLINVSRVTKNYGDLTALSDVTFKIKTGECVALVGPNGAGKSTLIKLLLGVIRPTAGQLMVLGREPGQDGFDPVKKSIGFLPEQVLLHGALTGTETLAFYSRLKGEGLAQISDLLRTVELLEAADRRVATYSKGMRQRLGLAQALIGRPDLLILDEPTSGLDPASRRNFFKIIESLRSDGAAILMSSHALTELEARTDRIAILNHGSLIADGSIKELKNNLSLSSRIEIKAGHSQMAQLAKVLAGRFGEGVFVNGVAVLECDEDQKMPLLKDLIDSKIPLDAIDIIEPSLEHVFFAYTAGSSPK